MCILQVAMQAYFENIWYFEYFLLRQSGPRSLCIHTYGGELHGSNYFQKTNVIRVWGPPCAAGSVTGDRNSFVRLF